MQKKNNLKIYRYIIIRKENNYVTNLSLILKINDMKERYRNEMKRYNNSLSHTLYIFLFLSIFHALSLASSGLLPLKFITYLGRRKMKSNVTYFSKTEIKNTEKERSFTIICQINKECHVLAL